MGAIKFITIVLLLMMNFAGAMFLETRMQSSYTLELVFILIGLMLAAGLLLGMIFDAGWAWPFGAIFFAASLANAVFLYFNVRSFLVFSGLLFFNLLGLVISVISIKEEDFSSETTDAIPEEVHSEKYSEPEPTVEYKEEPKKKKKK